MVVVGDPVALVSVGKCRKLWERYLALCSQSNSFHGFSQDLLASNLDAIELKKIYGLNPLAAEFVPRPLPPPVVSRPAPALPPFLPPSLATPLPPPLLRPPSPLYLPPLYRSPMLPLLPPAPPPALPLPAMLARPVSRPLYPLLPAPPRPPLYFPPLLGRPPDPASILPRGVELTTMQQSPDLSSAWYSHLLTAGLFQDAEMFLHLLASSAAQIKPVQLASTTEGSKGEKYFLFGAKDLCKLNYLQNYKIKKNFTSHRHHRFILLTLDVSLLPRLPTPSTVKGPPARRRGRPERKKTEILRMFSNLY